MKIKGMSARSRWFLRYYHIHTKAEKAIENAQKSREKAIWAAISGLSRAGVYWLS